LNDAIWLPGLFRCPSALNLNCLELSNIVRQPNQLKLS